MSITCGRSNPSSTGSTRARSSSPPTAASQRPMREGPQQRRFPDGRLHLQHGPIDLIIEAFGPAGAVEAAYAAAWQRFAPILDELCAELPRLRAPAGRNA